MKMIFLVSLVSFFSLTSFGQDTQPVIVDPNEIEFRIKTDEVKGRYGCATHYLEIYHQGSFFGQIGWAVTTRGSDDYWMRRNSQLLGAERASAIHQNRMVEIDFSEKKNRKRISGVEWLRVDGKLNKKFFRVSEQVNSKLLAFQKLTQVAEQLQKIQVGLEAGIEGENEELQTKWMDELEALNVDLEEYLEKKGK